MGGDKDELLHPGGLGSGNQMTVALGVHRLGGVGTAPGGGRGRRHDLLDSATGWCQGRRLFEIAKDDLRAGPLEVAIVRLVADQRSHRPALLQQPSCDQTT